MYNKLERFRNLENRCYEGAVKDNIGVWINLKQLNHLKQMFASNKKWFLKLGNAVLFKLYYSIGSKFSSKHKMRAQELG